MHTPEEQAWERSDLQQEIEIENVEDHRTDRQRSTIEVLIRHPDLSEGISIGPWYLSGALERILEALQTNLPNLLIAMEAGIPEERRTPLSPTLFWRSVHSAGVVVEVVVSDGEIGR